MPPLVAGCYREDKLTGFIPKTWDADFTNFKVGRKKGRAPRLAWQNRRRSAWEPLVCIAKVNGTCVSTRCRWSHDPLRVALTLQRRVWGVVRPGNMIASGWRKAQDIPYEGPELQIGTVVGYFVHTEDGRRTARNVKPITQPKETPVPLPGPVPSNLSWANRIRFQNGMQVVETQPPPIPKTPPPSSSPSASPSLLAFSPPAVNEEEGEERKDGEKEQDKEEEGKEEEREQDKEEEKRAEKEKRKERERKRKERRASPPPKEEEEEGKKRERKEGKRGKKEKREGVKKERRRGVGEESGGKKGKNMDVLEALRKLAVLSGTEKESSAVRKKRGSVGVETQPADCMSLMPTKDQGVASPAFTSDTRSGLHSHVVPWAKAPTATLLTSFMNLM